MTTLALLLRTVRPTDPASDADLLARVRAGDGAAFAALVQRHGRLVWAACRHQTRTEADADDCFQAVWLAVHRRPGAVRDPAKLSAFLHAVAVRVCRKHRAASDRRTVRERACAVPDAGRAVPDSAWDRALAAVHEEVARLPEPLRVAFVRCGLEGQGVTEVAAELGWKLGTLSGRLTRAKDLLVKRLDARGLTAGAVAATACTGAVPVAVAARTAELAAGGVVPSAVLKLTYGAMAMNRAKLLAAGLMLAGGLGAGVGGGWVGAQDKPGANAEPGKPPPKPTAGPLPAGEIYREPNEPLSRNERTSEGRPFGGIKAREGPAKWEYYYRPMEPNETNGILQISYELLVEQFEANGWQYLGQVILLDTPVQKGVKLPDWRPPVMAFRRHRSGADAGRPLGPVEENRAPDTREANPTAVSEARSVERFDPASGTTRVEEVRPPLGPFARPSTGAGLRDPQDYPAPVRAVEPMPGQFNIPVQPQQPDPALSAAQSRIATLEKELAELRGKEVGVTNWEPTHLPVPAADLAPLLSATVGKRFPAAGLAKQSSFKAVDGTLSVNAPQVVRLWVKELVDAMRGPPVMPMSPQAPPGVVEPARPPRPTD